MIKSIAAITKILLLDDTGLHLQALDGTGRVDIPVSGGVSTKQKYPRLCERGGVYYTAWTNTAMTAVYFCRIAGGVPEVSTLPIDAKYRHSYPTPAIDSFGGIHLVMTRWVQPANIVTAAIRKAFYSIKTAVGLAAGEPAIYYYKSAGGAWENLGILPKADLKEYRNIAASSNPDGSVTFALSAWLGAVLIYKANPGQKLTLTAEIAKPAKTLNVGLGAVDKDRMVFVIWNGIQQAIYSCSFTGLWKPLTGWLQNSGGYDIGLEMSGIYIAWAEKISTTEAGTEYRIKYHDGTAEKIATASNQMGMDGRPVFYNSGNALYLAWPDGKTIGKKIISGTTPEPPIPTDPDGKTVTFTRAELDVLTILAQELSKDFAVLKELFLRILGG